MTMAEIERQRGVKFLWMLMGLFLGFGAGIAFTILLGFS